MIILLLLVAHMEVVAARGMGGMARIKKVLESLAMLWEVWCLVQALSYQELLQFYQLELVT
jgi:hypothetical protein